MNKTASGDIDQSNERRGDTNTDVKVCVCAN